MPQAISHDRVKETTTTTGTGNVTLLGAVAGFVAFGARYVVGEKFAYAIVGGTEWETGIGTMLTSATFSRQVAESSNADALVNFGAGTKEVWMDLTARKLNNFLTHGQIKAAANGYAMP